MTHSWVPNRVLVTRSAAERPHGAEIVRRCEAAGVERLELLPADRLPSLAGATYAEAKGTLAVVVAPPSQLRPQPIPPSADWRLDLARGCPAHCQYCYLAGSLSGPPITRAYANLDDVVGQIPGLVGTGTVTSASEARAHEGTTFEVSCYTDPLALEAVTGSLSAAVTAIGTADLPGPAQLRFTTKFDDVAPLLALPHHGRTRVRMSVNAQAVSGRFEGGTAPVAARLAALGSLAAAGYPVGLTIAPVMPVEGWREQYAALLDDAAAALGATPDVTVELITHRFTPGSRDTLLDWYPRTKLEMDPEQRTRKHTRFGSTKYVYPTPVMREMRAWFTAALADRLPAARLLYWT